MEIVPFHTQGDPEGDFYALATVAGRYYHTKYDEPAHFVLSWSPTPGLTAYSCSSVSADGKLLSYHGGVDMLDTAEYALLSAAVCEGVPAHCWRLYPAAAVAGFAAPGHQDGYAAARRRLAVALWHLRCAVWLGAGSSNQVLFRPNETGVHGGLESHPDYEELLLTAASR